VTAGPDSATCGDAKNSWLTGTASWSYVVIAQRILGVRPHFAGLVVDPCVPATWKHFTVHRRFRDRNYHIHVTNPTGISRGVMSITANGRKIDGNMIPLTIEGPEVDVEVTMGDRG